LTIVVLVITVKNRGCERVLVIFELGDNCGTCVSLEDGTLAVGVVSAQKLGAGANRLCLVELWGFAHDALWDEFEEDVGEQD